MRFRVGGQVGWQIEFINTRLCIIVGRFECRTISLTTTGRNNKSVSGNVMEVMMTTVLKKF
jgi:hypothetical protein